MSEKVKMLTTLRLVDRCPSDCDGRKGHEGMSDEYDDYDGSERAPQERRAGPPDRRSRSEFTEHVKAADTGISIAWRWIQIAVVVVGFGITIGIILNKFETMQTQITNLNNQFTVMNRSDAAKEAKIAQLERDVNQLLQKDQTHDQVDRVLGERIAEIKGEIRREK